MRDALATRGMKGKAAAMRSTAVAMLGADRRGRQRYGKAWMAQRSEATAQQCMGEAKD